MLGVDNMFRVGHKGRQRCVCVGEAGQLYIREALGTASWKSDSEWITNLQGLTV